MDKLTLVNSRKVAEEFILFFRAADLTFLRSNEQLVTTIQKEFRGNVWFLESDCPPRRFLDNLFYSKISEKVDKIKQIADKIKGIELMVQVSAE